MKKLLAVGVALALTATGSLVEKGWATSPEARSDLQSVTVTVEEVAILGIVGSDPSFVVGAPTTGGDAFVITETNADASYLQYSSIVNPGQVRKVTASTTTNLPGGVILEVTPTTADGGKVGAVGTAAASKIIFEGTTAKNIVTGIGSGYTGTAPTDGVRLHYSLALTPESLVTTNLDGPANITVTYTLSEGI
ncbi:MAG: hypothetical protein R6W66_05760 [Pelovirga sp.]